MDTVSATRTSFQPGWNKLRLPATFTLDGMTELEEAELTDGQGRAGCTENLIRVDDVTESLELAE
jgi:hypothetical protein